MAKTKKATQKDVEKVRDRIKEFRRVPASTLINAEENPWDHDDKQRKLIRLAFQEIGIAAALLVRELPDGTLRLIDGHMRREELLSLGDQDIPVLILDVEDKDETALVLTINAIGRMALANKKKKKGLEFKVDHEVVSAADMVARQQAERYRELGKVINESKDDETKRRAAELEIEELELNQENRPSVSSNFGENGEGKKKKKKLIPNYEISTTRMVQLFFDNKTTFPEFIKMCQYLGKILGVSNITDTVLASLRKLYAQEGGE